MTYGGLPIVDAYGKVVRSDCHIDAGGGGGCFQLMVSGAARVNPFLSDVLLSAPSGSTTTVATVVSGCFGWAWSPRKCRPKLAPIAFKNASLGIVIWCCFTS